MKKRDMVWDVSNSVNVYLPNGTTDYFARRKFNSDGRGRTFALVNVMRGKRVRRDTKTKAKP